MDTASIDVKCVGSSDFIIGQCVNHESCLAPVAWLLIKMEMSKKKQIQDGATMQRVPMSKYRRHLFR